MKKKFLALVLTLAMVLSLVPATALAAGTTQSNIQNPDPPTNGDEYVKLEKTAAAVEGRDNTFEITLKATVTDGKEAGAKTSTDAVLVIDRSGSMNNEENGDRITPAQNAAKAFASVVLGEGANTENQIAVVSYAESATTNTGLSSDLNAVKNAINFSAFGGTNIQAGIKAARDILNGSTANNKVILVLSDGEPTYSFLTVGTATQTGCCPGLGILVDHYSGTINPDSVRITGIEYSKVVGTGRNYELKNGTTLSVTCEHGTYPENYTYYKDNGQPTIQEASYAKDEKCEIYSIYLGKPTDTNAVSTMKKIATDETSHYKLATDASELGKLFKGIAEDITLPVTPGIVTDPMGDHMNLLADSLQNNSAVTTNDGGFTWDLTKVTPAQNEDGSRTYELKYRITFNTDFTGFDANTFYPTNQETTLSYIVNGKQETANFPIPAVKGKATTYQLTYHANGGNEGSVPTDSTPYTRGAKANLNYDTKPTHDPENEKNVIFIGWSETPDTTIYDKGSTIDTSSLIQSVTMNGDKTVYAVWGYDAIGENDEPDGVPDVFNAVVTYKIVYGTWVDGTDNGTAEKQEVIKVKELKNGVWTDTNNRLAHIPSTEASAVKPNSGFTTDGAWRNPAPTTNTVVKIDKIYTYTLEAAPPAPTYTLTYDANGGKFGSDDTKTETIDKTGNHALNYTSAYTPIHAQSGDKNVIFLGWSAEKLNVLSSASDAAANAKKIITSVNVTADGATVYAVWSLDENNNDIPDVFEATITYKIENGQWTEGGTAIGSNDIIATFQLYEQQDDHTWKATDKLLRDSNFPAGYTGTAGYTGLGWYRNSETTPSPSELVRPTTRVMDAVTGAQTVFTYKYAPTTSKTYTVVLHLEGGSYTTTPDTYTKNNDGTYQYSVTETSAVINPESPSRNNFGFEGWSLSKSAPQTLIGKDATFASLYLEQSGMSGNFDKINLYAVWKESEPSVTVNKKVETVGGKTFERDKTVARQNDKIVWSVTVTNEKDTPAQVTLTDVMAAGVYTDVGCQTEASAVNWDATAHSWTATVSPKGSSIYYVCYTVTQDDISKGKIVNTIVKGDDKDHPINSDPVSTWDTKQLKSATSLSTSDWTTTVTLTLPTVNKATDNNTVNPVVISKGSYVIDKIGNEFTFVPELKLTLKVGDTDTTYTGEKVENTDTYNFGTKVGEEYPYTVTYTAKNDETQTPAQFKWEIKQDIPAGTKVTLSYKLKLTNPNTAAGTYGVTDLDGNGFVDGAETTKVVAANALYTNESATLYKDKQEIAVFPKPSVSYTIKGSSGGHGGNGGGTVTIPDDVPTGLNGKDHYAYVVGYPDGMVYPQKNITRAEVATIFFRLLKDETREANMTKSNSYNDMKDGAWYTCAVSTLSKMGIIKGYEDGSFKPDASISRAEFAAIAARFDPDGDKTPATFSDVSSHWAKDEISIAANHGWIKGYEDGSFKPDQKITRAETMTLVNRVLKRLPETKDDLHKDMKTWPDNQNESAWFYLAVQEATNSHYQKLKKDGIHETWESMRETRDWAALEK